MKVLTTPERARKSWAFPSRSFSKREPERYAAAATELRPEVRPIAFTVRW